MNLSTTLAYSFLAVTCCLSSSPMTHAANLAQPNAPASPATRRILVVETTHPFELREFTPPLEMSASKQSTAKGEVAHPEDTLRAYFEALKAGDYERFMSLWSNESQAYMREQDRAAGRTPEFWRSLWSKTFVGRRVMLTHWINYGPYVLIQFRIGDLRPDKTNENILVLKQDAPSIWKLTQELRDDQFLTGWNEPSGRIRVPAEALLRKKQ